MNRREAEVLELIRQNPYLSQQEMAERLNISRPSLANFISNLIKQGKILGRAYVLPEEQTVFCIGGANVDRKFRMNLPVQMGTSNPAAVTGSVGGVARNVAENLGRLGHVVKLVTVAGLDPEWNLIRETSSPYMSMDFAKPLEGHSTGTYTAVLQPDGEMILAMADMEIYGRLTPDFIAKNENALLSAAFIVIDLNCPKETVAYIRELAIKNNIPLGIIAVSAPKMDRLGEDLTGVSLLVLNQDEAESYLGIPAASDQEWRQAVRKLQEAGAESVIITAGARGAMAGNEEGIRHYPAIRTEGIVDVTGAGDAFSSALIHSILEGSLFSDNVRSGMVNAAKTLQSKATVRPELTAMQLKKELEELK